METNTNLWTFIADAGVVVKFVMILLGLASLFSWTIIVQRFLFMRHAKAQLQQFEQSFWSGGDLTALFTKMKDRTGQLAGLENIFYSGFDAFLRINQSRANSSVVMENVNRAMRGAIGKERDRLEQHLSFLATVGSTSPYVGLFGTVWGIMTAFKSLGTVQQASIAMVAPGISEALIATAMGLFAAIPAVIAYNRFANSLDRISNQYETFHDDFYAVLQRQTHASDDYVSA